jgi:hypothetical protein
MGRKTSKKELECAAAAGEGDGEMSKKMSGLQ